MDDQYEAAQAVACPLCQAPCGEPCRVRYPSRRHVPSRTHRARVKAVPARPFVPLCQRPVKCMDPSKGGPAQRFYEAAARLVRAEEAHTVAEAEWHLLFSPEDGGYSEPGRSLVALLLVVQAVSP